MGRIENNQQRKQKNERFIKAFEYVAGILGMSQGKLATLIGSQTQYISKIRNGLRPVPEESIDGLIQVAEMEGIKLFREYLYGNSEIMLLDNVSEKEMSEVAKRKNNPDYEVMNKSKEDDIIIPSWADSLIHLVSNTTASTEQLRRENAQLRESIHELIEDNKILRQELLALVREMRLSSHINARYTPTPMQPIPKAAESNK